MVSCLQPEGESDPSTSSTSPVEAPSTRSKTRRRSEEEEKLIEANRQRALDLFNSQVIAHDQDCRVVVKASRVRHHKPIDSGGGFLIDPPPLSQIQEIPRYEKSEEETDPSDTEGGLSQRKKKRRKPPPKEVEVRPSQVPQEPLVLPRPPDEDKPVCDECYRDFDDSYLLSNFDCQVCDACRDHKGIHALITRSTAKERYLLNDVDLDVREPPLRRVYKKNPRNSTWGDMQLFLEAQVAARSLEVWGSEEKVEEERALRDAKKDKAKQRSFQKKVKELRLKVRSSVYSQRSETHVHSFGDEVYDEKTDTFSKTCTACGFTTSFEKM